MALWLIFNVFSCPTMLNHCVYTCKYKPSEFLAGRSQSYCFPKRIFVSIMLAAVKMKCKAFQYGRVVVSSHDDISPYLHKMTKRKNWCFDTVLTVYGYFTVTETLDLRSSWIRNLIWQANEFVIERKSMSAADYERSDKTFSK